MTYLATFRRREEESMKCLENWLEEQGQVQMTAKYHVH